MSDVCCYPGSAHPNAALPAGQLCRRFGVDVAQVHQWLDAGLPQEDDGRIDPFVCANWLSWGPLETAPALQRLWRMFLGHFRQLMTHPDFQRSLKWKRESVLYLPSDVEQLKAWYVPLMQDDFDWQQAQLQGEPRPDPATQLIGRDASCLVLQSTAPQPHLEQHYQISLHSRRVLQPQDADYQCLFDIMCTVVSTFDYHYRVHQLDDHPNRERTQGTCLDAALYAAAILQEQGFSWRICGGVIAHAALLNAHHWLEVETTRGWAPFDVSIPAIARMLGEDWREWCRHYCGALDAGRIALTRGPGDWDVPGGNFISAATGTAVVLQNEAERNAWPCLDWVCGECDGAVTAVAD